LEPPAPDSLLYVVEHRRAGTVVDATEHIMGLTTAVIPFTLSPNPFGTRVKLSLEVGAVGSTRRLNGWFQAYWFFFFVTHIETKCILKRPVGKKKIDLRWKKLLDDVTYTI
jgi:hypothetical protein